MGESLLVLTLVTLIVITIRRAKPVILDNPVIIQRPGEYHITLAPQLNRAQTFIEQIARKFSQSRPPAGDLPAHYYEVRDPKVFSEGESCYLLAISLRGGILYFQAINPKPLKKAAESHYQTVHAFADIVMIKHPIIEAADEQTAERLRASVDAAAGPLMIAVSELNADV